MHHKERLFLRDLTFLYAQITDAMERGVGGITYVLEERVPLLSLEMVGSKRFLPCQRVAVDHHFVRTGRALVLMNFRPCSQR